MRKRIFSILGIAAVLALVLTAVHFYPRLEASPTEGDTGEIVSYDKESVYLWYTDDTLTSFLSSAAVAYNEAHATRIIPVLKPGLDYLEAINRATIDDNVPDLYLISNDALGRAYLAGLAEPIDKEQTDFSALYPEAAQNAVAYRETYVGYPFYFDTTALLYNRDYLEAMAVTSLVQDEAEAMDSLSEEPPEENDTSVIDYDEGVINARATELIPVTMTGITELANNFAAPEGVEAFFKWDVTDIFYNYFFLGGTINVGGEAGWDKGILDIYNEDAIRSLEEYQKLNSYFSIDTSDIDYEGILNEFVEGKIVFTIATTDVAAYLASARDEGALSFEYGAALIPDINGDLPTRSLSTVSCVAVNPFSQHSDIAHDFARFLTTDYAEMLYSRTGRVAAAKTVTYDDPVLETFVEEFAYSIPMPKMIEAGNLWMQLEAAFAKVWDNEDPNETLKALAEQMLYQVTGEHQSLDRIETIYVEEEIEYLDEEALRNEALAEDD